MQRISRHPIYVLPQLRLPRRSGIHILILADGNQRGEVSAGGYGAGARNVIAIAEHLAARSDVSMMIACILSPDNIAKRGQGFFAKVREQFAELERAVQTKGTLLRAGVRLGICGDLGCLRARGGEAALLAGAIEAVVRATRRVSERNFELLLGVGYASDAPIELDVDIILRTGMEADGALRLSGLASNPGITNVATTKLWPETTPQDVDLVIDRAKCRSDPVLAQGHSPGFVLDVLGEMSRRVIGAPVSVTIPTNVTRAQMIEAIDGLSRRAPQILDAIAVRVHHRAGEGPTRHGAVGTLHEVHIIEASSGDDTQPAREIGSIVAPGQVAAALILPERPRLGHATVHACGVSAVDVVAGICAATRFAVEHPPLLGADRAVRGAIGATASGAPDRAA